MQPRLFLKRFVSSPEMQVTVLVYDTHKVFTADIKNLLSMADMWRSREKPTPLDFGAIVDGSFVVKEPTKNVASSSNSKGQTNGHATGAALRSTAASNRNGGLKDQRALTLQDNLTLFVSRYTLISNYGRSTSV